MKEAEVRARFVAHLEAEGWSVPDTPWGDHADVDATHRVTGARLVGEVKGHTKEPGLDVDTAYGQLLRRMSTPPATDVRYALVLPESVLAKAERVPARVRDALGVELWIVPETGPPRRR